MKKNNPIRNAIVKFFNFIFIIAFLGVILYVSTFTDIPNKLGNVIRKEIEEFKDPYETYNEEFKINELSISNNMYYFNTLTKEQKYIYESIANGVKNLDDEFVVRYYDAGEKEEFAQEVSIAIEAFTNDHPEVFYLKAQYSSYIYPGFDSNIGYIRLNYTEDTNVAIKEKIALMAGKVDYYSRGLEDKTDIEKEIIIHDRISNDVTYYKEEDIPRKYHTAEGTLLEGIGVCDSFSKAYQLVLNKVGIESIIVLGDLNDSPHAWNMVKIGDNWYHVDITTDNVQLDSLKENLPDYGFFNASDRMIADNREIRESFVRLGIPVCSSETLNYHIMNNQFLASDRADEDHFDSILLSHLSEDGIKALSVKFENQADYEYARDRIEEWTRSFLEANSDRDFIFNTYYNKLSRTIVTDVSFTDNAEG